MSNENKQKEQENVIEKLLNVDPDDVPMEVFPLKRLGINVTLKALDGKKVFQLRKEHTFSKKTRRGQTEQELDDEGFSIALINAGTVEPNWSDQRLLDKFKASSGEEVIKRLLLFGEISEMGDIIMRLSGFDYEEEDIKN